MVDVSLALQKDSQFNNQVENKCKEKYLQQIETEKKQIEKKIDEILKNLGNMSNNSQYALTLFQKLAMLKPILSEIGAAVATVDNDVYYQLYIKFRTIFKQFNSTADKCTVISQQSLQGKNDPKKMEEIQNSIKNVGEQLKSIQQNVYSETKRYIIWVDVRDSQENKTILLHLQNQYKTSITVKFFSDINVFKAEFPNFKGQPLFFILSGKVSNDLGLFNWLKEEQDKDKIKIRIKGIVIFTSPQKVNLIKEKFMKDPPELVRCATADTNEMITSLQTLISPSKFCRLVGIEEFSYFFTDDMKNKLLNIHREDREHKRLAQYHPDIIKLENIFETALKLFETNDIKFYVLGKNEFDVVKEHLQNIFKENNDEKEIAIALLKLYSREDVSFYKLINSTLNTMNEKVIEVFYPVIEMFASALYFYDDSEHPEGIKHGTETILLRGSSILIENYNDICKVDNLVTLPAFSSFTTDINVAITYATGNNVKEKQCIFIYTQKMGNMQLPMRPKYISPVSQYKDEKEYLTYPCVCFKIAQITPKTYKYRDYVEILLVLN